MKNEKFPSWIYLFAVFVAFVLVVVASAQATQALASAPMPQVNGQGSFPEDTLRYFLPLAFRPNPPSALVINHTNRDINQIPLKWIEAAKQNIVWSYGSTAHGFQLLEGAAYFSDYVNPPTYNLLKKPMIPPAQGNPIGMRAGFNLEFPWNPDYFLEQARHMLDSSPDSNAFAWGWCGQMSWMSTDEVQQYLDFMTQLESEYPGVRFVYMTGRADKDFDQAILKRNNDMVRNFAQANDKILFDFNDMDNFLPDGTPVPGTPHYHCEWCQDWCASHPGYCPVPEIYCTHSESLDCYLKGQAFWWLSARLAGWDGVEAP